MAPHSSTLAWKIPWTEEPGRLQSMGSLESDTTERLHFHFSLSCIGEGSGNPLQCSCLENPRDGEPGGLPSLGSHRVRHDWSNLAAAAKNYDVDFSFFCLTFYFYTISGLQKHFKTSAIQPDSLMLTLNCCWLEIFVFVSEIIYSLLLRDRKSVV